MDEIEISVLEACGEYVARQHEMLSHLAAALGVEESQVFYTHALRRACAQRGSLADANWVYFFHGYDCDFRNQADGRRLGIYFAPKGRVGTLGEWEVLRFIMTSVAPWREFPELRSYFARNGPPFDEYSGMSEKIQPVWDRLESRGFFEQADPALVALRGRYTTRGADGLMHLCFPSEISEQTRVDSAVAHRQQFSHDGANFLKSHLRNGSKVNYVKLSSGTISTDADFGVLETPKSNSSGSNQ